MQLLKIFFSCFCYSCMKIMLYNQTKCRIWSMSSHIQRERTNKVGDGQGMLRKTRPYNLSDKLIRSSPQTHNLICHTSKDRLPQVLSNDSFNHSWTGLFFICINNHPSSVLYLHIRCSLGIWYWYEYWYGRTYQPGMIWGNTTFIPVSIWYGTWGNTKYIPTL